MFKPTKWELWFDSLPEHTKRYIKSQPIWYDKDLALAAIVGFAGGLLIGLCF